MKRCLVPLAALVLALSAGALAGCGRPAGTDGDLVNGWAMPGAARFFTPVVGHCYDNSDQDEQSMAIADFQDMPCTVEHDQEVVAAQVFTGEVASAAVPPQPGSAAYRAAWLGCDAAANTYLGGNWRDALAFAYLVLPNTKEWLAGDRNYACALVGQDTKNGGTMFGYYRNGLTGARPAARTCFTFSGTALDKDGYFTTLSTWAATPCGTSHDAEYVGWLQADTATEPAQGSLRYDAEYSRCVGITATFLNRSVADTENKTDMEPFWFWPSDDRWTAGDHSFSCYVAVPSIRPITRSLKGIGSTTPN